MKITFKRTRSIALLTGSVLAASSMLHVTPVQAADKSKKYKIGAAILGAAGAYMILKGKTVPGAVAGAGAYYAYKKGQKAKQNEKYGQYPDDPRYSQYPNTGGNYPTYGGETTYPDDSGYDPNYRDPNYRVPTNDNGSVYPDYGYEALSRGQRRANSGQTGRFNPRTVLK